MKYLVCIPCWNRLRQQKGSYSKARPPSIQSPSTCVPLNVSLPGRWRHWYANSYSPSFINQWPYHALAQR